MLGVRVEKVGPVISAVALGVALCLLVLAPLASRLGWWPYSFSLYGVFPASGASAAVAAAAAIATLVLGRSKVRLHTLVVLGIAVAVAAPVAWLPLQYAHVRGATPAIHDIATDTEHRPVFKAVEAARELERADRTDTDEPRLSELQRAAYPDIAPVYTTLPARQAFGAALAVAQAMPGWIIVAACADAGQIEASQRSRWFGFTDDVVIRVSPGAGGVRIDMRSASRKGTRDYGVNAARVRAYMRALKGALGDRTG